MVDPLSAAASGDVHVGDWTLVRVPERLTAPGRDALVSRVRRMLRPGARVAVDTRHLHLDDSEAVDALHALADAASAEGATVAFVVPDPDVRSASLDDAVGDSAPASFEDRPAGLAPAAGDTQLVATKDVLGRDPDGRA